MLVCEGQSIIDSLKNELKKNTRQDTTRAIILYQICQDQVYRSNEPDSVMWFAKELLQLSKTMQYPKGIVLGLKFIGITYFEKGHYKDAEKFQNKAIAYASKHSFLKPQLGSAFSNLANAQLLQGNYMQALDNYLQALKIAEESNDLTETAKALANLGVLYKKLADRDNALHYYLKAYALTNKVKGLPLLKVSLTNNIASVYMDKKNYTEALKYLRLCLQSNIALNNAVGMITSLANIGICFLASNNLEEAAPYIERAFQLSKQIEADHLKTLILTTMSTLRIKQGRINEAINYANEGLRLALELKSEHHIGTSYLNLAEAYALKKEYKKAYQYEAKTYLFYDSLKGSELNDKIVALQKSYELGKKESKINQLNQQGQIKELELRQERTLKYILMGSLLTIIGLGYVGFRIKTKLNNQLHERYIKIKQQNEVIESINQDLRSQALRAQMNPHFIFNALNSIQYLILKNSTQAAFHYLSQFAELLRGVLDNSDKQWISIRDEIKTLELYLELESLRFNDEFDYTVNCVTPVPFDNDLIPSMVIQPFVENAILHGLRNKTGKKSVSIIFSKENDIICCQITDNGIGRQAANELRAKQMTFVESKGMKLVDQRLKVLNNLTQRDFSIQILDLVHDQQPSGTKIILTFSHA